MRTAVRYLAGGVFLAGALSFVTPAKADAVLTAPIGLASGYGSQLSGAYGIPCLYCPNGYGTNGTIAETLIAPAGNPSLNSFTFYLQASGYATNLNLTAFVIPVERSGHVSHRDAGAARKL